jgi:hypothetical protein
MMRIRSLLVLLVVCLCWGNAVSAQDSGTGFVPTWKIGDTWTVEASYRDMKNVGEPWLPPVRWVFRVRAEKNIHRTDCYVIHVYPEKRDLKVQAVLYLGKRDLRALRVIDIFPTASGVKSREKSVDALHPIPLIAEDSIVPYDLPVFPLVRRSVQQSDSFAAYKDPEPVSFARVKSVGGFTFKSSVQQTNKKPDRQLADSFSSYRYGSELFEIQLFDATRGGMMTQVWQTGAPWALSSDSPHKRVRLISTPPVANPTNQSGGQ